jgi:hypothetical protein
MKARGRSLKAAVLIGGMLAAAPAAAQQAPAFDDLMGQVLGGGAPIAGSTVTLWAAGADEPKQLAQARTGDDGRFTLRVPVARGTGVSLYLLAQRGEPAARKGGGDNPAIGLLAVLGDALPSRVVINEMTTVASVWTHAQFLDGTAIRGHALGLRIAAGNVPNFVDLATGGYGTTIQDGLNSNQTPTMATFATLSNVMAGCLTSVRGAACNRLFAAATPPNGKVPSDTVTAFHSVARNSAYKPERLFALLDHFYPVPKGKRMRATPFMPYLDVAPSAWVLPLKFAGGGAAGTGKMMFTSEGDAWVNANFLVGSQGTDSLWNGNLAKFASNGKPLSPMTTGFSGGGLLGPGFGLAVDANDRAWVDSTSGQTISLFDKNGKPLSPPEGYNFGGKLKAMQGIIVAPNGDVWALDFGDDKVVHMSEGDPSKAKFYCESTDGKPNKDSPCKLSGPFHLAIDQQDRIWITNAIGDTVTRFPASNPSEVEVLPTGGHSGKGMAIDSQGNAWITNTLGTGMTLETKLRILELKLTGSALAAIDQVVLKDLLGHPGLGSVSILRPDGSPMPGSPVDGIWGAWAVSIDGNDHAWVAQFAPNGGIVQLCGARTETCPPGMKTGDAISPPGGYKGGGMQMLVEAAIDPAGNVWAANNWQDPSACYGKAEEGLSTRCGGQGFTVFYGMAKPVRTPLIGPVQRP